jgi:hypothetical protein
MLSQKTLYVASRLYVAASKAGVPFDLAVFTKDRNYAQATLASLASQLTDPASQTLIAEAMIAMTEGTTVDEHASMSSSDSVSEVAAPAKNKYIGKLR